jgi:transcription antitermination protein NusB
MSARSKARKRALDVLYESEVRGLPVGGTLADRVADGDPPVNEFTVALVEGVSDHIGPIGVYELLFDEQVPDVVAVSEAVSMARDLSTDESPAFVNGLLARLLQLKPTLGV